MFALVVAGRPVITTLQTISQTQFAFTIPSQPTFSHIVVFFLPGNALPADSAAAVYVQMPPSTDFKLLGAVGNDKQSAIFKVRDSSSSVTMALAREGDDAMVDDPPASGAQGDPDMNIVLGISVEPAANIQAQLVAMKAQSQAQSSGLELTRHQIQVPPSQKTLRTAQRIIENAFNFLSSFSAGTNGDETVPLKAFRDWWTKFEKKIQLDPGFLDRDQVN